MTRSLLVLRPEPGASATVAAARVMGLDAISAPLFTLHACPWTLPDRRPGAVLLTSANAVLHAGPQLAELANLPVYAVGAATAEAARRAGFAPVIAGDGDAAAAIALAARDGIMSLIHLAGREHRKVVQDDLRVDRRIVYAADAIETLPGQASAALPDAVALLHSPRAAQLFASLVDPAGIAIAAISPATRDAAGSGWRMTVAAERPTDASLLAVAAKLCNQDG